MDPSVASIIVSLIGSTALVVVAGIQARKDTDMAVRLAVRPKDDEIERLRKMVKALGGNPDA